MLKPLHKSFSLAVCGVMLAALSGIVFAGDDAIELKQIQDAIPQVAAMKGQYLDQTDTGKHLAELTKKINPNKVDDRTLENLESLLDSTDDLVRYWGAISLGNLGPRAKPAVPKMLKVLTKVDCLNGAITSADGIRFALKHIGVESPPYPDCVRISG